MRRALLALPVLAAIAPVIALYANNAGQARFSEAWLPFVALMLLSVLLLPAAGALCRSRLRGAVVLALFWLFVFSYGHIATLLARFSVAGHNVANYKILLPVVALLGLCAAWAIRRARNEPVLLARVLMVIVIANLATSLITIARFQLSAPRGGASAELPEEAISAGHVLRKPDIYYFIFDRYGSARTLQHLYGWDNQPFLEGLRARGFYVADDSRANYLVTAHSLASSLNLSHILALGESLGPESTDWVPLFELLAEHRLGRFLAAQGYRYIHAGPDWAPNACNPHADVCYRYQSLPEFSMMLVSTTAFYPLLYRLGINNPDLEKYRRVNHQLDLLARAPRAEPSPKFVFAHFLVPHGPFVFNRDGSFRRAEVASAHNEHENYLEQVQYVNGRIEALVRSLLESYPPEAQPVIVIQGDEGPYPPRTQPHEFDWSQATDEEINEKMRILNAIYAPGCEKDFYPGMTPVNTFRIILNHYFGTALAPLPDRSYTYRDLQGLYDFIEVTGRIDRMSH